MPTPLFTASPTTQCVGQPIQFTDQSTGGADQWLWDFGDGSTSAVQNPVYTYTKPGTYDVTLTAYNQGCLQSLKKTAFITINPPLADFKFSAACGQNNNFTFTDMSTGALIHLALGFQGRHHHSTVQTPPAYISVLVLPQTYNVTTDCNKRKLYQFDFISSKCKSGDCSHFAPNPVCNNTLV